MNHSLPFLIQAMLRPDFYPHAVEGIHLYQTHISWVILTGEYAYKVKKPVDFGFLDFSTLEKRHHFCEEELRLNRRLARDLYLDVLPIGKQEINFLLGGTEGIVEWCVKMRQFGDNDLLDEHIRSDSFNPKWLDALARDIATFHTHAKQSPDITAFGAPCYLLRHIDASLNTALHHPEAINPDLIHDLRRNCMAQTEALAGIFEQRMDGGQVRDCHGDLHLGNIALYRDKPTVFDCIEFNPEYRAIDTLSDAAFLVMDLDARGHADLSFRFLSRYLEFTGDYTGMDLLPLFLCYRASVRGKVACLLAEDQSIEVDEKQRQLHEATKHFDIAADYLNQKTSPHLFAIGGLSGSGKSHLALLGCGPERAIIIRSDATRKRIVAEHPDLDLYSDAMNKLTYQTMFDTAAILLRSGWPVILDATFLSADERQHARDAARTADVPFHFIWLDIPEARLREHIQHRQTNGTNISDANLTVLEQQLAHYQRPDDPDIHFLPSADIWPHL